MPPWLGHLASLVSGTILASTFFGLHVLYLLVEALLGLLLLAAVPSHRGPATALAILTANILAELWLVEALAWHQVRGAVMILSMKIISLAFDMDTASAAMVGVEREREVRRVREEERRARAAAGVKQRGGRRNGKRQEEEAVEEEELEVPYLSVRPGVVEYLGYCLCPASVVLGPWSTFAEYRAIFLRPRWNLTWLVKVLFTVTFAFMFLTISTCWNPWLIPDSGWRWWLAYRDAMSFRASHYFVSFMSEAAMVAAGFGCSTVGGQVSLLLTPPHLLTTSPRPCGTTR